MLKTLIRLTLKTLLYLIGFIALYALAAFLLPYIQVNRSFCPADAGIPVYIESNGVHTDFVLPVKSTHKDWSQVFPYSDFEKADSSYRYVAIGWGDKGFFLNTATWDDLTFGTAFKAVTGLSSTAMHITYKKQATPEGRYSHKILIDNVQYRTLIRYIESSFQKKDGKYIAIKHPGYSLQDCFYEAEGTYCLFKTCNVWTGKGLKQAGIKTGIWTPFESGIMNHFD